MRTGFFSLVLLSCGISSMADTIKEFVIVNSSTLSPSGGSFTSGGGTFSGTFEVDISKISPSGAQGAFNLTSWDIVTTGPSQDPFDLEFVPSQTSAGTFIALAEQDDPNLGPYQVDAVKFDQQVGLDDVVIQLFFFEPVGRFNGGVIFDASEEDLNTTTPPFGTITIRDNFGTGTALDPAILAPEPGCGLLLATGLGLTAAGRRWRCKYAASR